MPNRFELGPVLADGDNFAFHRVEGVVVCRVWRRPDLSMEAGASCAERIERLFKGYSSSTPAPPSLFDVSEGPSVMGPVSEGHVAQLLRGFEHRRQPLAVVCGEDGLKRMQYGRLVGAHAKNMGSLHVDFAEGMAVMLSSKRPGRP